jgi:hypothetical protein
MRSSPEEYGSAALHAIGRRAIRVRRRANSRPPWPGSMIGRRPSSAEAPRRVSVRTLVAFRPAPPAASGPPRSQSGARRKDGSAWPQNSPIRSALESGSIRTWNSSAREPDRARLGLTESALEFVRAHEGDPSTWVRLEFLGLTLSPPFPHVVVKPGPPLARAATRSTSTRHGKHAATLNGSRC